MKKSPYERRMIEMNKSPQQMMSEAKVRNQYSDVFCKKPLPPYKFVDSPYMTIDPNEKRGLKGPPGKPNWKPGGSSRQSASDGIVQQQSHATM